MELRFHTLDVFTDRTFGGNPLGVFPGSTHLPTALMQRIAREMNLSETVFLGPPESPDGDARVRIFTPALEVPFAGHPTVGTAVFLATREQNHSESADGVLTLALEENVGLVPAEVRLEPGEAPFARFTTAILPEHRPSPHSRDDLAKMVGLDPVDLCPDGLTPEMVSCGLPYHVIPVASAEAVGRAVLNEGLWRRLLGGSWAHHVYLITLDAEGEGVDVHVRMFAPGSGVAEDPATGSAAAALGGYLSALEGGGEGRLSWTIEQGLEMGRPSRLYVEADCADGETRAIRVGGRAVHVSEGTMTVPD